MYFMLAFAICYLVVFLLNLEASLSVAKVINGGLILGFESFLAPRNAGSFGWFFQGDGWVRRISSENSKKASHSFTCQYISVFESLNILYKVNFKTCLKLLGLKIYQELL